MYEDHKNMNLKMAVQMAAPHTWPAAVGPCLVAGALVLRRTGSVSILMWTALMLICILMQSAANIFNDYFDLLRGTDQVSDYVEKNDAVLVHNNILPGRSCCHPCPLENWQQALPWAASFSWLAPASMKNVGIWLLLAALGFWGIRSLFVQMRLDLEPPCRPYAMKGIARLNGILSFLYFLWLMTG